ncbi:hypothetical protein BGW36DRAFT_363375 [Talaromyces proteolyticus]|uniref:Amidase domain-containing protein n=1 Tax=Talaromyces proteolyticus TaxID=1131652 RepID=A0AAD4PWG9_9EURO|nr:uncharacterized protein BGW36DRAFT_363375 [Talaromyces proteolyticus]KAH8692383.1 hypothetical protein BGW36DRAFT_363375 [Talaromyces proteolyticus]
MESTVVKVGCTLYLVHPEPLASIQEVNVRDAALCSGVLISSPDGKSLETVNCEDIIELLDLCKQFISVINYKVARENVFHSGPYFLQSQYLKSARSLYSDNLGAFTISTIPQKVFDPTSKLFIVVHVLAEDCMSGCVAVPRPLYYKKSPEKPLAGMRISLKDSISVYGIKNTMMNRSYTDCEPAERTATSAQLGPTLSEYLLKLSFTFSINYILFSLQWQGKISGPAAWNGLFSLRTSFGVVLIGIVSSCKSVPIIYFVEIFIKSSLGYMILLYPKKIIYPLELFPERDPTHQEMINEWVQILERSLGVKREEISLEKCWKPTPREEYRGKSLQEYLDLAFQWSIIDRMTSETVLDRNMPAE